MTGELDGAAGTVLVVDDSRSKRYIIGSWLRRAGYQVHEAQTGAQALERLAEVACDAVVLDVRLPDINGFEVAERIKADPRWVALPVVHVSATAVHTVDRTEGLTRGADAYLVEPIDPDELLATLRAVLRYYRARRHAERLADRLSRLAEATLAVNMATTFESLLEAAAAGASRIFGGPSTAAAVTPDGRTLSAVCDGPEERPRLGVYEGEYVGGLPPDEVPVGARVLVEPLAKWQPNWKLGPADGDLWLAVARPKENRPAAYVVIPAGSAQDQDESVLVQMAQAVALAVEAMRSYDEERRIALTLQRSLLPRSLPEVDGYDLAVRYLPASAYAEVGGDFYELATVDGQLLVAIGDVVGHSLHAATVMAEVRHALRAYVADGYQPDLVLDRLNSLMLRFIPDEIATVCVLTLDPGTGRMRMANAGHLPPLLSEGTTARYLDLRGPLLGVSLPRPGLTEAWLPRGGTLTLFTDGLIERRAQIIDHGLDRLRKAAGPVDADLGAFCDRLLGDLEPANDDDVALIALRRR